MDGYVSIATNTHHEICYIYLGGGVTLTPALVSKCCEISSLKTQVSYRPVARGGAQVSFLTRTSHTKGLRSRKILTSRDPRLGPGGLT